MCSYWIITPHLDYELELQSQVEAIIALPRAVHMYAPLSCNMVLTTINNHEVFLIFHVTMQPLSSMQYSYVHRLSLEFLSCYFVHMLCYNAIWYFYCGSRLVMGWLRFLQAGRKFDCMRSPSTVSSNGHWSLCVSLSYWKWLKLTLQGHPIPMHVEEVEGMWLFLKASYHLEVVTLVSFTIEGIVLISL